MGADLETEPTATGVGAGLAAGLSRLKQASGAAVSNASAVGSQLAAGRDNLLQFGAQVADAVEAVAAQSDAPKGFAHPAV